MDSKEANGANFIPASQRPDGTWRKPRRVKEGYVPQEEVPLYESKGKQFMNRKPQQAAVGVPADVSAHHTIPGLFINQEDKVKKEKKKAKTHSSADIEHVTKAVSQVKIAEVAQQEPAKRLKNLKKRLREIEALEQKIHTGDIKCPEKEQLEKVARKKEVVKEIRLLESSANN